MCAMVMYGGQHMVGEHFVDARQCCSHGWGMGAKMLAGRYFTGSGEGGIWPDALVIYNLIACREEVQGKNAQAAAGCRPRI